jgi:glycosyltransferase involved in cell wall biosynthesis
MVIFDNIFARNWFMERFASAKHRFAFIPFGSEVDDGASETGILTDLGLKPQEYFLFVGRFIPDKGLQHLIAAFETLDTDKKLVLVGGAPNRSSFEQELRATRDSRIVFPGFRYDADAHTLMRHAYAYVQPSVIEGLSPVILENMALGTPVICSDIPENVFVVENTALTFRRGDVENLGETLEYALACPVQLRFNAVCARERALKKFSWTAVVEEHVDLFGSVARPSRS